MEKSPWATVAARLLQVHVAALFVMMALSKLAGGTSNVWWVGDATWSLAVNQEWLSPMTPLGIRRYLFDVLTHSIVWFELLFPLLIWWPLARPLVLSAAVVMWSAVALLTGLTAFCLMMFIVSLAFVQPETFRALLDRRYRKRSRQVTEAPRDNVASDDNGGDASASHPRKEIGKSAKISRRRAKTK